MSREGGDARDVACGSTGTSIPTPVADLCPPESDCTGAPTVTIDGVAVPGGTGRWAHPYEPGAHEVAATRGDTTMSFPVRLDAGKTAALELPHRPDVPMPFVLGRAGDSDPKPRHRLPSPASGPPLPDKLRRSVLFLAAALGVLVLVWLVRRGAT